MVSGIRLLEGHFKLPYDSAVSVSLLGWSVQLLCVPPVCYSAAGVAMLLANVAELRTQGLA